jgi:UDP-2,4-diacetamido-2,4,6-trideoxy-beta-L-altropyranose hydrolase
MAVQGDAAGVSIAWRADASTTLGSGHVMRGLTLAAALRARGARLHFVCQDLPGHLGERIRAEGHALSLLPAGLSPAEDARATAQALGRPVELLGVDHYGLDAAWEHALRPYARRLAVIDDLADRPHDADLLLDQNLGRQATDYDGLLPAGCRRLIGPGWALLRPGFACARPASLARRADGRLRQLLISMGGADPQDATARCLHALAGSALPADTRITVVLGALADSAERVAQAAAALPWPVEVLRNVADMAPLLASADLAIGAAGGSAWERCCLGLPALLLILADNQRPGQAALVAAGAGLSLGTPDDLPQRLAGTLATLTDPGTLAALSQRAAALCDGRGAERVADEILNLMNPAS